MRVVASKLICPEVPWYFRPSHNQAWKPPQTPVLMFKPGESADSELFVERARRPDHGLWAGAVLAGLVIPGCVVGVVLLLDRSFGGPVMIDLMSAALLWALTACGLLVIGGLTLMFVRTVFPWPLTIRDSDGHVIVKRSGRGGWCPLSDLRPGLTVGVFAFVPIRRGQRPTLGRQTRQPQDRHHGIWLSLSPGELVRWVLLDFAVSEPEAMERLLDWTERLGLDPESALAGTAPPNVVYLAGAGRSGGR